MALDIIARAAANAANSSLAGAASAATAAQASAASAQASAASAESTATSAQSAASAAQTTANGAQTTATAAQTAAAAAQATANTAQTAAASAQTTADSAQTSAASAVTTANAAQTTATSAQGSADAAQTTATAAQSAATSAQTTATAAQTTANSAQTAAATAQTTATSAQGSADTAQTAASSAQTAASSAQTAAAQALAATAPADLFTNIGTKTIDASISLIQSSGYSALGKGAGLYVCDSLATAALATAHPHFCKVTANGRYFRLIADSPDRSISVAQGGAVGQAGTNDQPAIQATVSYACATACKWVEFPETLYELWCPIRTTSPFSHGIDGHQITITTNDGLGLRGCRGGTTLNLKNSAGGSKDTITQTVSSANWQGGGIYVLPGGVWPGGGGINWVAVENLTLDGGVTYNSADRSNTVLNDKGLWVQDITCNRVHLRNCTFKNFAGEIYYVGGATIASQLLENVILDGSPQSALNPSSSGKFVGINVQAGNSYQACEVAGALSFTLIGGRFYDCYSAGIVGGPDGAIPAGFGFNYATRQTNKRPPWAQLIGTRFEGFTDGIYLGAWVHGSIVTTDCIAILSHGVGHLRDVHLNIEAWADQKSAFPAVVLSGPASTTTQIPSAPAGSYFTPPSNIRVNVTCKRTALAQANSRYMNAAVVLQAGLYDKNTVNIQVSGDAHMVYSVSGTPPSGFAVPRINSSGFKSTGQPYGGIYDFPATDKNYDVLWAAVALYPSAGTWNLALGTTHGYADGQRVIFYHGDPAGGKVVSFGAAASGLKLQKDRKLYAAGDYLELRYDGVINKWVEERYLTATQQTFTGSATYDAPSIAAGSSATTTVTATGAALGDFVSGVSLGISPAGLVVTGYVSAANTVTVVLYNPTAAAIDLASATLSVSVQRK